MTSCPKCKRPASHAIALRGSSYACCESCLIAQYVGPSQAVETLDDETRVALFGSPDLAVIIQRAESDLARFALVVPTPSKGTRP